MHLDRTTAVFAICYGLGKCQPHTCSISVKEMYTNINIEEPRIWCFHGMEEPFTTMYFYVMKSKIASLRFRSSL